MNITAFGHALHTIHDGLTIFDDGRHVPVPLVETTIAVEIVAGLATIRTLRCFRNIENRPIEAILTMPVGFDAVVTGLSATVDGRKLVAVAKPKAEARDDYEAALDSGKLAVLHEEVLRGVHALSIGNLAPGKEVSVEVETVAPLSLGASGPFLRIPVTVGQLYGASPFSPVDDLVTSSHVSFCAALSVTVDAGRVVLGGRPLVGPLQVTLDAAIEIELQGGSFGKHQGVAADGRQVHLDLKPLTGGSGGLDLAVLVDHSGSTSARADGPRGLTVWEAIRDGLRMELGRLRTSDRIALWQFESRCKPLGEATGPSAAELATRLEGPSGGTELGGAMREVLRSGAQDILVLTDGQTWAHTVDELAGSNARISAILVGAGSLDANIGQLCAMTGGQVFYAPGDDVAAALVQAFATLRRAGRATEGSVQEGMPERLVALRSGIEIKVLWSETSELRGADAIGRFAAALAQPLLPRESGEQWARAHGLCSHRTSLVLVDEAGETVEGMAQMRKVPLMEMSEQIGGFATSARPTAMFSRYAPPHVGHAQLRRQARASGGAMYELSGLGSTDVTKAPPFSLEDMRRRFATLKWDQLGDDFLALSFDGLDDKQRALVDALIDLDPVSAFALKTKLPVEVVALALIADLIGGRTGDRYVRRAFRDSSPGDWQHLRLVRLVGAG
ncbi:VIT domain-containing protein [Tabrizicola sp. BL-A-41-H6]|uniref:VIT domain-containing protein n=1 Tax=Tabrizicola sp. BL-A-41-H6 TaxID=3421107 RepID=UPI003D67EB03